MLGNTMHLSGELQQQNVQRHLQHPASQKASSIDVPASNVVVRSRRFTTGICSDVQNIQTILI